MWDKKSDESRSEIQLLLQELELLRGELVEWFGKDRINPKSWDECDHDMKRACHVITSSDLQTMHVALGGDLRRLHSEKQRCLQEDLEKKRKSK